tara:strand:+ start:13459 stop:13782 length:324 start_codon:yes stop_codon:yes gene_type:complete
MRNAEIIPEEILNLTWNELMAELYKVPNCCIDAQHFIVTDLHHWLNTQRNFIDNLVLNGVDCRHDKRAKFRKKQLREILHASNVSENHYPVGSRPIRFSSIYPLREK